MPGLTGRLAPSGLAPPGSAGTSSYSPNPNLEVAYWLAGWLAGHGRMYVRVFARVVAWWCFSAGPGPPSPSLARARESMAFPPSVHRDWTGVGRCACTTAGGQVASTYTARGLLRVRTYPLHRLEHLLQALGGALCRPCEGRRYDWRTVGCLYSQPFGQTHVGTWAGSYG